MRIELEFGPFLLFGRHAWHASKGRISGPARAACFNCYLVDDGTLHLEQHGATWLLRPGQACLVDPGCTVWWEADILLNRFAFDLVPRPRYRNESGRVAVDDWTPQPTWRELFDQELPRQISDSFLAAHRSVIHRLSSASSRSFARLRANAQVAGFVSDYAEHLRGRRRALPLADTQPLCRQAEAILTQRIPTGITIAELATLLGCSHEHLSRTYKKERGHSLMAFVRSFRLQQAQRQLVRHPQRSVRDIARSVGLKDHRSLDRLFKQSLGCTPREWRRQAGLPGGTD